jgi:hypothetical protein
MAGEFGEIGLPGAGFRCEQPFITFSSRHAWWLSAAAGQMELAAVRTS